MIRAKDGYSPVYGMPGVAWEKEGVLYDPYGNIKGGKVPTEDDIRKSIPGEVDHNKKKDLKPKAKAKKEKPVKKNTSKKRKK